MFFLSLSGLALLVLSGCAGPEKKVPDLVWPLPPEEPRIKLIDFVFSRKDVGEPAGEAFKRALFGEETVDALTKPYGVAADSEGRIYVTDIGRVFIFDKKNKRLDFLGDELDTGQLRVPIGIAVSRDGIIYVTDVILDRVMIYNKERRFIGAIGQKGEFDGPSGVAVDDVRGRVYIADTKKHKVVAYSKDGNFLFNVGGGRGIEPGEFNFPTNIAVDKEGRVYVVDTMNFRVQIFDQDGKFMKSFGRLGDSPGSFARPKGIAVNSEGHIYVVDSAFSNFQIFDQDGNLLLFVGNNGRQPGQFIMPAGITIDNEDRIYVVDSLNPWVQIFEYLGSKWKAREEMEKSKTTIKK